MMYSDDGLQEPLVERFSPKAQSEPATNAPSKKRKREPNSDQKDSGAKKTKKKKQNITEADELDLAAGINRAFAHMDGQLLADYLAQRTNKFESDLSQVELEDVYIPGNSFPRAHFD